MVQMIRVIRGVFLDLFGFFNSKNPTSVVITDLVWSETRLHMVWFLFGGIKKSFEVQHLGKIKENIDLVRSIDPIRKLHCSG